MKEEIKDVKENVATLTTKYSLMQLSMSGLLSRQAALEEHYKSAYTRMVNGCKAKAEEK